MNWRIVHSILLGICLAFSVNLWLQQSQHSSDRSVSYAIAVNKAVPAVVNIYTTTTTENPKLNLKWLLYLQGQHNYTSTKKSLGSGIILAQEGIVVTSQHIVNNAQQIVVILYDGSEFEAKVIGEDNFYDLAFLKINSDQNLPKIDTADINNLNVGDIVLAIGNPFGLGQSVSQGIISGLSRKLVRGDDRDYIQTDAAINPGNSGGALIDLNGRLIGLNSRIFDNNSGTSIGIGFAIPIDIIMQALDQIVKYGKTNRPWYGFYAQYIYNNHNGQSMLYLNSISPNSPAQLADLKTGDIIISINEIQNLTHDKVSKVTITFRGR